MQQITTDSFSWAWQKANPKIYNNEGGPRIIKKILKKN